MHNNPLVTVLLATYNHINTFEKAINSVLEQKTNFPFQIIVLDDASCDGTSELVKKYKGMQNVKVIISSENSNGKNIYSELKTINTKYFAILDTDDYWCDENKLQMQVDVLENNPDCSFCAHNTMVNYTQSNMQKEYIKCKSKKFVFPPKRISPKYYIEPHTSSRLYRTKCLNLEEIKNPLVATYDIASNFYFLTKGNLYYIDKIMSVYNYTNKGIYSGVCSYKQRYMSASVIAQLNDEFDYKYNRLLSRFFSTKLNLNIFTYWILKFTKNKSRLAAMYEKILNTYQKKYLENWEQKPILLVDIPFSKMKRIVFEIRREKKRV